MNSILYNPFHRIAGLKALSLGLLAILLTAGAGWLGRCHFDGALDIHVGFRGPAWLYPAEGLLNWLILSAVFYAGAIILSRSKIRLLDIAGTVALARYPLFFAAVLAAILRVPPREAARLTPASLILVGGFLIVTIWTIVLLYNAYAVAGNLKGAKAIISFIVLMIVAEIITKVIFLEILLPVTKH